MDNTISELDEIEILKRIDIAERRKAAARDENRTEFLEVMGSVVEALPEALLIADENGKIILANLQAELIFGYHREQLIGQPVEMLVPQRSQHNHAEHRQGYQLEPRVRALDQLKGITGRRRDGCEVAIEIMLSPVVTRKGVYTLAVIRRKRNG